MTDRALNRDDRVRVIATGATGAVLRLGTDGRVYVVLDDMPENKCLRPFKLGELEMEPDTWWPGPALARS